MSYQMRNYAIKVCRQHMRNCDSSFGSRWKSMQNFNCNSFNISYALNCNFSLNQLTTLIHWKFIDREIKFNKIFLAIFSIEIESDTRKHEKVVKWWKIRKKSRKILCFPLLLDSHWNSSCFAAKSLRCHPMCRYFHIFLCSTSTESDCVFLKNCEMKIESTSIKNHRDGLVVFSFLWHVLLELLAMLLIWRAQIFKNKFRIIFEFERKLTLFLA